ncbi:MAG: siderophore-interacting protein [Myxococcales bacterium]|nr:siderophore-interacting protein [Myxococcales bacterium]
MGSKQVRVTSVTTLSERLRSVRLAGPALVGAAFAPGDKVKLQVAPRTMRSYTPSRFDADEGWLEVVMVVHGKGPGSRFAATAQPGDVTHLFGPVHSMAGPRGGEQWAWFLGDETTVGLARALLDALPGATPFLGAIELDGDDATALGALGLPLDVARRHGEHGRALLDWIAAEPVPEGPGVVWVSGHAGAVQRCERALLARGVPAERICTKPYWNRRKDRMRALFSA